MARVIDEQLLARPVLLTKHDVQRALPLPVQVAEPAVLVSVAMSRLVLEPQQLERHTLAAQFLVYLSPLRHRPRAIRWIRSGKEPGREFAIGQL